MNLIAGKGSRWDSPNENFGVGDQSDEGTAATNVRALRLQILRGRKHV